MRTDPFFNRKDLQGAPLWTLRKPLRSLRLLSPPEYYREALFFLPNPFKL